MMLSELKRHVDDALAKHGDMEALFASEDNEFEVNTCEVFHIHGDVTRPKLFGMTDEEEMP